MESYKQICKNSNSYYSILEIFQHTHYSFFLICIKSGRFYITPEILENLNKDKSQILLIETVLDRNHYIEFYVKGLKDNNNKQNIIADNFFNEEEGLPF